MQEIDHQSLYDRTKHLMRHDDNTCSERIESVQSLGGEQNQWSVVERSSGELMETPAKLIQPHSTKRAESVAVFSPNHSETDTIQKYWYIPTDEDVCSQDEASRMLNITISAILLLASGSTAIPEKYFKCTELFLKSIRNDKGEHPTNIHNILKYLQQVRNRLAPTWQDDDIAEKKPKPSRIPVLIKKPKCPRSFVRTPSSRTKSFEDVAAEIFPEPLPQPPDNRTFAYFQRMAFEPGFNQIFNRLLFPDRISSIRSLNVNRRFVACCEQVD